MASYANQLLVVGTLPRKKDTHATIPAKQQKPLIVASSFWELMGQLLYVMVYAASLFFSYEEKKDRICGFQIYENKIFRFVYI